MRVRSLLLSALLLVLPLPVLADTVFTYTGNTFTTAPSPFTTSDFITGSITINVPVLPDTEYIFNSASSVGLVDFTFSDGIDIFSKTYFYDGTTGQYTTISGGLSYQLEDLDVTTDSNGNIASWFIDLQVNDPTIHRVFTENALHQFDQAYVGSVEASNLDDPGTWTEAPEPSSFLLFGTGLIGSAGFALRRSAIRW